MSMAYRPPEEGEAFNTFHDMVHAAILCARSGTATLKEIYAACVRFGRVKCRKTGGWRLVTERRNWKSHVRHTLYTTEKFLRCPNDPDSWMLAPEFCGTLPQTTRQFTGGPAPPEDDADVSPRPASRGRPKTAHWVPSGTNATVGAGERWSRPPVQPLRRRAAGTQAEEGNSSFEGQESDSNEHAAWEEGEQKCGGRQVDGLDDGERQQELDFDYDDEQQQQQQPDMQQGFMTAGGAGLLSEKRAAAAKTYGVGSRNGRAKALLGVTAAAAAAAAAASHEDLGLSDEETRTALNAAQEVLNNPAAATILLRLMRQRAEQEQQQQLQCKYSDVDGRQDAGPGYRPRRRRRLDIDPDGGLAVKEEEQQQGYRTDELEQEEQGDEEEDVGRAARLRGTGRAAPWRHWREEGEDSVTSVRLSAGHEVRAYRLPAAQRYPQSMAPAQVRQLSTRAPQRAAFPGGDGGAGRSRGEVLRRPVRGVSGALSRHGTGARCEDRDGEAFGPGRRMAWMPSGADAAWHKNDGDDVVVNARPTPWVCHPDPDGAYEEWDESDEQEEAGRPRGIQARRSAGRPVPAQRGGRGARAAAGITSRRGSKALAPQQAQYVQPSTAHLNAAATTAAAAAAAAVAAATVAGDAPLRITGHPGVALGKRGWAGRDDGAGAFEVSPGDMPATDLYYQPHQLHRWRYLPTMHAPYPGQQVLWQVAEELQMYHSRSTAAAAAAAASAVAANVQQPRGFHGRVVC